MGVTVKISQIGNSLGVILPKEVLAKLGVEKGETLHVINTPDGVELSAFDPDMEAQLDSGRQIARRYRNALRQLAK